MTATDSADTPVEQRTYETIMVDREDTVLVLTLDRPERHNALNRQIRAEIVEVLGRVDKDPQVRVIIIWGGTAAFAAGADLNDMAGRRPLEMFRPLSTAADLWGAVARLTQPVIAAVAGPAFGGGCELAQACDLRIAADTAMFAQPEVGLGLIPGGGACARLARLVGPTKAKELILSGDRIDAQEALRIGLVNRVVPVQQLLEEAKTIARKIASKPLIATALAKLMIDSCQDLPLAFESLAFAATFSTDDQQEGVNAFLEKRPAQFVGR